MITAYRDVPTAVSAMRAEHFVQKPFDAEALLATVEEALSRTDVSATIHTKLTGIQRPAGAADAARARGPCPSSGGFAMSSWRSSCASAQGRPNTTGAAVIQKMQARISPTSRQWRSLREISTAASAPQIGRAAARRLRQPRLTLAAEADPSHEAKYRGLIAGKPNLGEARGGPAPASQVSEPRRRGMLPATNRHRSTSAA